MVERAGFWNFIAKRYARSPVADEASYQEKLRITQEYLQPDWEVFEFGCGTGTTAVHHASKVRRIHTLDISKKMLDIARERAAAAGVDNITFEQAGISAWDAPENAYDAALGMSIIHLVEDPALVLAKVFRLLRPGGVFISSTVCIGDTNGLERFFLPVGNFLRVLPYVARLKEAELQAMLVDAGFEIEQQWRPSPKHAAFIVARKPA